MQRFDLIVIGGGSGGLAVAERAAAHGAHVAVMDDRPLGGTCVNQGCVPKKLMWYAAEHAAALHGAPAFGFAPVDVTLDYRALAERRDAFLHQLNSYWAGRLAELGIVRIDARAHFATGLESGLETGPVLIAGQAEFTAPHIAIATGSQPVIPSVPGAELGGTSDDFFRWRELPRRIAIVGGGYIGVELAGMLRALGSAVTLIALQERVLAHFDPMVSEVLQLAMHTQGIDLRLGQQVSALTGTPGAIEVHTASGLRQGPFDAVIWAVGRRPHTAELGLSAIRIEPSPNGAIPVDGYQCTARSGVYALGDVTQQASLTPTAIAAGRRLADRLFGNAPQARFDYALLPTVVFAHPPVGAVGLTEPAAVAEYGAAVRVYETRFTPLAAVLGTTPEMTAMKLVCAGPEERVVGVHIVGRGADELMQGFAVAVHMGARKTDLDATLAIHPTSAEELVTLKTGRPGIGAMSIAA